MCLAVTRLLVLDQRPGPIAVVVALHLSAEKLPVDVILSQIWTYHVADRTTVSGKITEEHNERKGTT